MYSTRTLGCKSQKINSPWLKQKQNVLARVAKELGVELGFRLDWTQEFSGILRKPSLSPWPASFCADLVLRPAPLNPPRQKTAAFSRYFQQMSQKLRLTSSVGGEHLFLSQSQAPEEGHVLVGFYNIPAPSPTSLPTTLVMLTWTHCCALNPPTCPSPRATALVPSASHPLPPMPPQLAPHHFFHSTLGDFPSPLRTSVLSPCSLFVGLLLLEAHAVYVWITHLLLWELRAEAAALPSTQ